jgi:hypothetical protein
MRRCTTPLAGTRSAEYIIKKERSFFFYYKAGTPPVAALGGLHGLTLSRKFVDSAVAESG